MAWAAGGGLGGAEPDRRLNVQRLRGDKVVLDEWSNDAPALAASIHVAEPPQADRLFMAWTGNDPGRRLNLMASTDGSSFSGKQVLNDTAVGGPALHVYETFTGPNPEELVVLAWTGGGGLGGGAPDGRINLAWSPDGATWPPENRLVLPHRSPTGPALAGMTDTTFRDLREGRLWLGWMDERGHVLVANCEGRDFGQLASRVERVSTNGGAEETFASPGLNCGGNGAWLAWPGVDGAHKINFMRTGQDAGPFREKRTVGHEFASSSVALDVYDGVYAYRGTDGVGQIYVTDDFPG
jgi:hypothetical protein